MTPEVDVLQLVGIQKANYGWAMGSFQEWALMPTDGVSIEAVRERFATEGLSVGAEVEGWVFARTRQRHELDALVERLSGGGREVAMGWWVYDSDFAYLVGVGRDRKRFALVVGVPYSDFGDVERALSRFATNEGRAQAAVDLAEWSETNAASQVAAEDVREILEKHWALAEDGLGELLERLDLPAAGDALSAVPR